MKNPSKQIIKHEISFGTILKIGLGFVVVQAMISLGALSILLMKSYIIDLLNQ